MSGTMFQAVVFKELRENVKWAVAVLLCMSIVLAVSFPSANDVARSQGLTLSFFNVLEPITTIGGLLAGLLFGAAQALVENRGDKWGFLAHRPISRTTMFWGKSAAGILLYAISTGLPVAAAFWWIASPGLLQFPFDWRMALPSIANLLCGLVFYFAGFLTAMRDARWYVSRTLGIGAAFCFLILQGTATELWQAIAAIAVGLVTVGTAAWGTFLAGGQYGAQPRIGRLATGVSIGLGIAIVGWLLYTLNHDMFLGNGVPGQSRYTYHAVTPEGVFVRVTTEYTETKGTRIVEVSDAGGRPLEQYRNATREQVRGSGVLTATLAPGRQTKQSFRSIGRVVNVLRRAYPLIPIGWTYVRSQGLIAAYDWDSRKLIGWMGPDGFSLGKGKPRRFPGRLNSTRPENSDPQLLVFEDAIYRVDLNERSIEKVFEREPAETILDAGPMTRAGLAEAEELEVIATTRRVIIQRRDGTRVLEAPQDASATEYPVMQVLRSPQAPGIPTFLWYQWSGRTAGPDNRVTEINSAGAVVNSWILPPTNREPVRSWLEIASSSAIYPLIGQATLETAGRMARGHSWLPRSAMPINWAVTILSSIIFAAAVFLRGRMYAFPAARLYGWTAITIVLGPLGYLTMLAVLDWPAREPCPACSRRRVVTRDRCEHCGEPFAGPPQDGTEIFEPVPQRGA